MKQRKSGIMTKTRVDSVKFTDNIFSDDLSIATATHLGTKESVF